MWSEGRRELISPQLNRKWIKIGTTLMSSLLATADGVMILAEDQLLRQIVDCFMELDQVSESFLTSFILHVKG